MDDQSHNTESMFRDKAKSFMSFSTPCLVSSGEDGSEGWAFLQKNEFKLTQDASENELNASILKCKELIINTDQSPDERLWLVRYLIQLRYRVEELKDGSSFPPKFGDSVFGHHFKDFVNVNKKTKQRCDYCCKTIWSAVQKSYICQDCGYICHKKCADKVIRLCAHVVATKEGEIELNICPEKGLASQKYKCAECGTDLNFKGDRTPRPMLCDYSGLYYCTTCHWNSKCEIPARVVHNWDWEKRPVSQAAFQLLTATKNTPLINLEEVNEQIFNIVIELDLVRGLRHDLKIMRQYLMPCQSGKNLVSGEMHLLSETPKLYSMVDLEMARDGQLETKLRRLMEKCRSHIMNCQVCSGKGYICEQCRQDEVIYPFDAGAIGCDKCNSLYHRACFWKINTDCKKCIRMEKKKVNADVVLEDFSQENNEDTSFEIKKMF